MKVEDLADLMRDVLAELPAFYVSTKGNRYHRCQNCCKRSEDGKVRRVPLQLVLIGYSLKGSELMILRVLLVVSFLIVGCEPSGSEFLMNARNFLLVNEETFEERLKERFIVDELGKIFGTTFLPFTGPQYLLKGQDIVITYEATDPVNLPGGLGSTARIRKKHGIVPYNEEGKGKQIFVIAMLLPYKVSKPAAITMLGYPSRYLEECSEDGLWRDEESGHTITVVHFDGESYTTRIMASITAQDELRK